MVSADRAEALDQLRGLWTPPIGQYALVLGDHPDHPSIINVETLVAILIEDEEIADEVRKRMIQAGAPILDRIPSRKAR